MKTEEMIKDLAKGLEIVSDILIYNFKNNIDEDEFSNLIDITSNMKHILDKLEALIYDEEEKKNV